MNIVSNIPHLIEQKLDIILEHFHKEFFLQKNTDEILCQAYNLGQHFHSYFPHCL